MTYIHLDKLISPKAEGKVLTLGLLKVPYLYTTKSSVTYFGVSKASSSLELFGFYSRTMYVTVLYDLIMQTSGHILLYISC